MERLQCSVDGWRADSALIECSDSWAARGDRNVFVRCEVRAKPQVVRLHWVIDDNGTTVSEGQVVREYWTLVMVSSRAFQFAIRIGSI